MRSGRRSLSREATPGDENEPNHNIPSPDEFIVVKHPRARRSLRNITINEGSDDDLAAENLEKAVKSPQQVVTHSRADTGKGSPAANTRVNQQGNKDSLATNTRENQQGNKGSPVANTRANQQAIRNVV